MPGRGGYWQKMDDFPTNARLRWADPRHWLSKLRPPLAEGKDDSGQQQKAQSRPEGGGQRVLDGLRFHQRGLGHHSFGRRRDGRAGRQIPRSQERQSMFRKIGTLKDGRCTVRCGPRGRGRARPRGAPRPPDPGQKQQYGPPPPSNTTHPTTPISTARRLYPAGTSKSEKTGTLRRTHTREYHRPGIWQGLEPLTEALPLARDVRI